MTQTKIGSYKWKDIDRVAAAYGMKTKRHRPGTHVRYTDKSAYDKMEWVEGKTRLFS